MGNCFQVQKHSELSCFHQDRDLNISEKDFIKKALVEYEGSFSSVCPYFAVLLTVNAVAWSTQHEAIVYLWVNPVITKTSGALFMERMLLETEGYTLLLHPASRWLTVV